MQLKLKGKGVIVTGGSRGIGLSIAEGFAAEGANVSICARDPIALEAARVQLSAHGSTVHTQSCDVSDADALEHYLSAACEALGTLNVLVNNASGFGRGDDEEGWQKSIDVDLMASVRGSWHAAPQIEKAGGGAIIHVSSSIDGNCLPGDPAATPKLKQSIWPPVEFVSTRSRLGRSISKAGYGPRLNEKIVLYMTVFWPAFPLADSAHPRKWQNSRSFWDPTLAAGSPGRQLPSMEDKCFESDDDRTATSPQPTLNKRSA